MSKNKGTSIWNFAPNAGLRIRLGTFSVVKRDMKLNNDRRRPVDSTQ